MTVENLEINIKTNVSESSSKTIESLADALGKLEAKASALTGLSNLSNILNAISGATVKASSLNGLAKGIENLHTSLSVITSDEVARLSELAVVLKSLIGVNPGGSSGMTKAAKSFRELGAASGAASGAARNLRQTARGIDSVSRSAKKSQSPLSNFVSSLKRIAFYRFIRTVIKEITKAFSEGLKNAYQFSSGLATEGHRFSEAMDSMKSAATQMKNQLGSAFIALLTSIEPVVTAIVNLVTKLADAISQLISAFTGTTYLKAAAVSDKFADDMGKGAKGAKEWKNQLLGFDVINRLNEPSGGGGGLTPEDMFGGEDALIDEKYITLAERLKRIFGEFDFSPITTALEKIKGLVDSIGKSFREAFSDGRGTTLLTTIWEILSNIMTTVGNLADSFRRAWDENDRGTTLLRNLLGIVQTILDCFNRITASVAEWVDTLDFGPIIDSFIRLTEAIQPLVDLITDALAWAVENVLEPLGKWIVEEAGPVSVDLLTEAIKTLTSVLTPLWEGFKEVWDEISPILQWFGDSWVETLGTVTEELRKFTAMLQERGGEIKNIVESWGLALRRVWDTVIRPYLEMMKLYYQGWFKIVMALLRIIIGNAITLLSGLCDFIKKLAEGDWAGAWNALKDTVLKMWENLKGEMPNLLNGVIDLINGWIKGFNFLLGGINDIAGAFGINLKLEIPTIGYVGTNTNSNGYSHSSGKFAAGGFPEAGSLFIANEAGPELVGSIGGRTAVANNDQIVEAVSSGVYNAVSSAMGNGNKNVSVHVYLDSREIKSGQQRLARATGG